MWCKWVRDLICKSCGKDREEKFFSVHLQCKSGYDTSRCKPCKKSRVDWQAVPFEKRMYNRVKTRAKNKNLPFNLDLEDIKLPEICPVLRQPLVYGDVDWTYSIDRIKPELGYIKGNIIIMSNRANRLKNNATAEELEAVAKFIRTCEI